MKTPFLAFQFAVLWLMLGMPGPAARGGGFAFTFETSETPVRNVFGKDHDGEIGRRRGINPPPPYRVPEYSTEARFGKGAMEFPGPDNSASIEVLDLLPLAKEVTVAICLKPAKLPDDADSSFGLCFKGGRQGQPRIFWAAIRHDGSMCWYEEFRGATARAFSASTVTTLPEVVTPGKWQHVAFVRKEDEVAIYHNGQPVAQGIVKQPKLEEGKDPEEMEIMVGAAIVSGHAFYVGLMDDFVLLDYALDASQIKKLAEEGWEKFAASDPKFKK